MVGTNTFVFAGVLAALLCVSSVDAAFKCYECVGLTASDDCADEFTAGADLESTATCMACTKTKINDIVARGCSAVSLGGDKCEEISGAEACYCDTELCNGSTNVVVSMATLVGVTLAFYFSKF